MSYEADNLSDWLVAATAACALAACVAGILREPPALSRPPTEEPATPTTRWVRLSPPVPLGLADPAAETDASPASLVALPAAPAAPAALGALPELPAAPAAKEQASSATRAPDGAIAAGSRAEGAGPGPARLGRGDLGGDQPWPEYPAAARRRGEAGTVTVRFQVDASGAVTAVRVAGSSGWRSLDEAAAGTIRSRWRFPPGPPRDHLVDIRFELL